MASASARIRHSGHRARSLKPWRHWHLRVWSLFALLVLASSPSFASTQVVSGTMNGAQEVPPHTTAATGTCTATIDEVAGNVTFSGTFSGLGAAASSANLRGSAGPGATAPVILTQTSITPSAAGTFSGSGTLTGPLLAAMLSGQTYCEIDDAAFPAGEIRGQLTVATPIPALPPGALALLAAAICGAGIAALRRSDRNASRRAHL